MKIFIFYFLFLLLMSFTAQVLGAQDLRGTVQGKWKVTKYQSQSGTQSLIDTLEFKSDGSFLSDSIYFQTKKGLFRTDENRSVLILEVNGESTEWFASIKKGIMMMRSTPASKQQPTIYITSIRVDD